MKKLNSTIIKHQIIVFVLFISTLTQAQIPFDDDVEDVPGAPIDNWVLPVGLIVILLIFFYFRKYNLKSTN